MLVIDKTLVSQGHNLASGLGLRVTCIVPKYLKLATGTTPLYFSQHNKHLVRLLDGTRYCCPGKTVQLVDDNPLPTKITQTHFEQQLNETRRQLPVGRLRGDFGIKRTDTHFFTLLAALYALQLQGLELEYTIDQSGLAGQVSFQGTQSI